EETILHMAEHLHKATGQRRLCIAGGVALNSVANGLILEQGYFDEAFIQPASGDNGIPVGSAFYYYNVVKGYPRRYVANDTFLGPGYSTNEVVEALKRHKLPVRKSADVASETARLLADKKVVGLFQ